jgi:hypothetical protein
MNIETKAEMETDGTDEIARMKSQHDQNDQDGDDDAAETTTVAGTKKEHFDPLFMDGLPSDFASNPKLAAIASLLDVGDYKEERVGANEKSIKEGGGKVKRTNRKHSKKSNPYTKPEKKKKKIATVGEAQLFLNLWKL